MKRVATQRGMPLVFLGESSGARMPDHMGSRGMGNAARQRRHAVPAPARNALGLGDARAVLRLVVVVCGALGLQRDAQGRGAGGLEPAARLAGDRRRRRSRGTRRLAAARRGDGLRRPGRRYRRGGARRRSGASSPTCPATTTRRRPCARCLPAPATRWPTSSICCRRAARRSTTCARSSARSSTRTASSS